MTGKILILREDLVDELDIQGPDELDIEAVAEYCGATVVHEPLRGCAARLIGRGDRAYITVNDSAPRDEQRFSVAHELAHWLIDHLKIVMSCDEETLLTQWSPYHHRFYNTEIFANFYAARLLLPTKILRPLAEAMPVTWESVEELSRLFQAPLIPTAIRLIDVTLFPAAVACSYFRVPTEQDESMEDERVLWAHKSGDVGLPIFPEPGRETVAYRLMGGGFRAPARPPAEDVLASEWFNTGGKDYTISEHAMKLAHNHVLSLLWWKDPEEARRLRHDMEVDLIECG